MNLLDRVREPLLSWYRSSKRDLPWRHDSTPYRVWVSEIMLQQTRVEAAREYYLEFLAELPTVQDLAECSEDRLLKLWEGLGYYSRVRNMQKAAKEVCESYGGVFPNDEKLLKKLPGIGEYTAGAISSIAFYRRTAAVDGNVMRVLSRYLENGTDISAPAYRAYLKEELEKVYPEEGSACSDFTQSLMELGALVCLPAQAKCELCPLKKDCSANRNGTQDKFPVLPEKKAKKEENLFVFLIETPNGICVCKRKAGVLKGMYAFPVAKRGRDEIAELKELGVQTFSVIGKEEKTHVFTHVKWNMTCVLVKAAFAPFETYSLKELKETIALPTAFRQCVDLLERRENL